MHVDEVFRDTQLQWWNSKPRADFSVSCSAYSCIVYIAGVLEDKDFNVMVSSVDF